MSQVHSMEKTKYLKMKKLVSIGSVCTLQVLTPAFSTSVNAFKS